jgi:DNA repair protein RecN (Recombination protein N)
MLLELSIRDFAIIDELRVAFEPGFNALTGETGAGKSILIDALGAVLGDRVGSDVVRTGARLARIEATFDVSALVDRPDVSAALDELGVEVDDGVVILAREVTAAGRSSARINGRAVTAGMLGRLGAHFVDIHGQSEHLTLLRPAAHLEILDRYAGLEDQRDELGRIVGELRGLQSRIGAIQAGARERAQRIDLLRFQVAEIEGAALRTGEEEELLRERTVLANSERLAAMSDEAHALLAGGDDAFESASVPAVAAIRQTRGLLIDLAEIDRSLEELGVRAEEALDALEDIAAEIRSYRDRIEADPARLEAVEERLDLIKDLKRKYGSTIDEVLAHGDRATRELEEMTGGEAGVEGLRERERELLADVGRRASALSARRCEAGERLARAVEQTIAELNMGRARFVASIEQSDDPEGVPFVGSNGEQRRVAVDATGVDRVEFQIAPNAGEALKPLGRIASGGEMARLMLALKSILSAADATPTLIFDEVDVGVGGRSGQVVGEKLSGLAADHQVLVISHLPQIAAFADAHFRIRKGERDGRVVSVVDPLDDAGRVEELAEMLDGLPVTNASRANAVEMLDRVRTWRAARADGAPLAGDGGKIVERERRADGSA